MDVNMFSTNIFNYDNLFIFVDLQNEILLKFMRHKGIEPIMIF